MSQSIEQKQQTDSNIQLTNGTDILHMTDKFDKVNTVPNQQQGQLDQRTLDNQTLIDSNRIENNSFSIVAKQLRKNYIKIMKQKQIQDEMKERIIIKMDQCDSNIFGSNLLPEQGKESKAIQLYDEMKNKDINELKLKFDYWMINIIKKRLMNCTTAYEKILLNIIELLAQKGKQQFKNSFLSIFQQSGFIVKIEQLLQDKFELEQKGNDNIPFSDITEQLMHIYIIVMKRQQIKDDMKERIMNIMDNSKFNIIGSRQLTKQEKEQKLIILQEQTKNKDNNELKEIFDYWIINIMIKRMKNFTSQYEKMLLDIIELVAEKQNQIPNPSIFPKANIFFQDNQKSELLDLIKNQIKKKIENEKNCSSEVQQLIRIYLKIMKERAIETEMIDICIKVLHKNIDNLFNIINNLKLNNNKGIMNKQESEEIEKELQQSTQLFKVIILIREQDPKLFFGTRIPNQINIIMKERIIPLMHIICPTEINCSQCISIQASSALQEFKGTVFQALIEVSMNYPEIRNMLIQDNNLIPHFAQFIISQSTQYQLEWKASINQQQQNQQQSQSGISPSFISYSLNFLNKQILNNNKCKLIIQIPNLLHSLALLINYNHNLHINNEQDQQSQQIRKWSRQCLRTIQYKGDKQDQSELFNAEYGRVLAISVSTAGGTEEQADDEIYWELQNISNFLRELNNGRNNNNYNQPSFPAQPALAKTCIEQIEDEGGNEEVESQLINKWLNNYINDYANKVKREILNFYIDRTHTRPQMYL